MACRCNCCDYGDHQQPADFNQREGREAAVEHLPYAVVDRVQVMYVEGRVRPLAARELGREQLHPRVIADEGQPPAGARELIDQVVLRDGGRREAGPDVDERRQAALRQCTTCSGSLQGCDVTPRAYDWHARRL